ncbi:MULTISPECIES: hypothetical protein [unclassified Pseudomonas]|uniref:hypothetical protein n=1 Tax=unclassified Pseudomonas TaxID=196821 RepID=UPI002AC8F976|nr:MULTISPECIES: hypothetical protein [unclassified Pseudomonas]MEB0042014.1 hypothetical protein [Pseudomonas sp. MH10]MEB0121421.1 hypothetical protein [Pseudomonas sp. CCI1.2]WPX64111.1 hypothetical protein RHM59_25225 [Pseudomonas sp. MH10]
MPASHIEFLFAAAAFAVAEPRGCQQLIFRSHYPPPSPVTGPVACIAAPPSVVLLG